jgi:hypothetical protein
MASKTTQPTHQAPHQTGLETSPSRLYSGVMSARRHSNGAFSNLCGDYPSFPIQPADHTKEMLCRPMSSNIQFPPSRTPASVAASPSTIRPSLSMEHRVTSASPACAIWSGSTGSITARWLGMPEPAICVALGKPDPEPAQPACQHTSAASEPDRGLVLTDRERGQLWRLTLQLCEVC